MMTTALLLASFLAASIDARDEAEFCVSTWAQLTGDGSNACVRCTDGRVFCIGSAAMDLPDATLPAAVPTGRRLPGQPGGSWPKMRVPPR